MKCAEISQNKSLNSSTGKRKGKYSYTPKQKIQGEKYHKYRVAPYKTSTIYFTQLCIALSYIILRFLQLTKSIDYFCLLCTGWKKKKQYSSNIKFFFFLFLPWRGRHKHSHNTAANTSCKWWHDFVCFLKKKKGKSRRWFLWHGRYRRVNTAPGGRSTRVIFGRAGTSQWASRIGLKGQRSREEWWLRCLDSNSHTHTCDSLEEKVQVKIFKKGE